MVNYRPCICGNIFCSCGSIAGGPIERGDMKDRIIQWIEFDALVSCSVCPLFTQCAYGWPQNKVRTASNCKVWRKLPIQGEK